MPNVDVLLTLKDIEHRYNYSKGTLTSLRAKGGFPPPDQQYGRTPLWRESTITNWYQSTVRRVGRNV